METSPLATPAVIPGFDLARFNRQLDASTGSTRTLGNRTSWLFDDAASFQAREQLIGGARETINLETYILDDDDTGRRLTALLCAAAQRGVRARLLVDGEGTTGAGRLLASMRKAGVEVRVYHPLTEFWNITHRLHAKQLIVDGKVAILGGRNYGDAYMGRARHDGAIPWRDTDREISGPAVRQCQAQFLKDWVQAGTALTPKDLSVAFPPLPPTQNGVPVRIVTHRPEEDHDNNASALYLAAIGASTQAINLVSAYFVPTPEIRAALIAKAKQVKIRILTNSVTSSDVKSVALAARYYYRDLIDAGIEIYEMKSRTLHAKTAAIDGRVAIAGSTNLDGQSLNQNIEIDEVTEDAASAQAHDAQFERDLAEATKVAVQTLKSDSVFVRAASWVLHFIAFAL